MVKEKPIIFTAESVRAILEGRKSQTRKVIKNPWSSNCFVWVIEFKKVTNV